MSHGQRRLVVRALGTVAVAVTLGACSSPKVAAPTTTTSPGSGAAATTASPTTSSAASTTTSLPPGSACQAQSLTTRVTGTQGAAGTQEVTFALRNASGAPCPIKGFPGALLLSATGAQLPTHVVPGGTYPFTNFAPAQIVLVAGESAYFNLGYSDVPHGNESSCPTATQIAITPPGASNHDVVAVDLEVCNAGTVTVSPVFIVGGPGSQTTAPAP